MNAEAIWDYKSQPFERVMACNLCGSPSSGAYAPLWGIADRYGFISEWRACICGLVYLSHRMTKEAYARFYETAYRPLVSAFHGREINAQTIQPEQADYARRLWKDIRGRFDGSIRTHLDIGGSTGILASLLRTVERLKSTILDPSSAELSQAYKVDHETVLGSIEDFDSAGRDWDLVTMCQTADHLLDLMGSLRKIRGLLSKDGLFWSDIVDFEVTKEVKIDHPFNLTERTYRMFLDRAGFKLLQVNYAPDGKHIGFLCRAAD